MEGLSDPVSPWGSLDPIDSTSSSSVSDSTGSAAGDSTRSSMGEASLPRPSPADRKGRSLILVVLAVIVVSTVILTTIALAGGFRPSNLSATMGETVAKQGEAFDIAQGQFDGITFTTESSATLTGSFWTTYNISVYVMTGAAYEKFALTNNISGYEWASGYVQYGAVDQSLSAGSWVLAFVEIPPDHATHVIITSSFVVTPS